MTIKLFKPSGKMTVVDLRGWFEIQKWSWWALTAGGYVLVGTSKKDGGIRKYLHRILMNADSRRLVDHINRIRHDNRLANLRLVDRVQNATNSINRRNRLGFRGIKKLNGKYQARINARGLCYCLGVYNTPEEAAKAYDEKAKEIHGDFAVLNFGGQSAKR